MEYAAALSLEVRQPSSGGEPVLRFNFKNGTVDDDFKTYNFMGGSGDVPLSQFIDKFTVHFAVTSNEFLHLTNIYSRWQSVTLPLGVTCAETRRIGDAGQSTLLKSEAHSRFLGDLTRLAQASLAQALLLSSQL